MAIVFGTDGARAEYTSPDVGYQIGWAAAEGLQLDRFVLVQDTRTFNPELAEAVKSGLALAQATAIDLGILPTPAAAIIASELTREHGQPWGAISLSASHNPASDYGIKVFGADGVKLDDYYTRRVEFLANRGGLPRMGRITNRTSPRMADFYRQKYINYVVNTRHPELDAGFLQGTDVIIDAANGAAYWSAATALRALGAKVETINANPAAEINKDCGATNVKALKQARRGRQFGFGFDGDADRNFTISDQGKELDGDDSIHIAMMAADFMGSLSVRIAVTTKYSNIGLKYSLQQHGIGVEEVINGDREVAQAMGHDIPVGGEQSGHTLFNEVAHRSNRTLTGDGTVTAIQLLSAVAMTGRSLEELAIPKSYPHLQHKVKGLTSNVFEAAAYQAAKAQVDKQQGSEGDNLGRLSGTEQGVGRILVRDIDAERAQWAMDTLEAAAQN